MNTKNAQEYIKVIFTHTTASINEILIALLSEEQYEGFEEEEHNNLIAYIPSVDFDESRTQQIATQFNLEFYKEIIAPQNWNAVWESNYDPVVVENIVAVRAEFHKPIQGVQYEIVITPKMSFGTGHHATTWLMLKEMYSIKMADSVVFDYGTGTGILAIFAGLLGAQKIIGNDIEDWTIENCRENFKLNNIKNATAILGELSAVKENTFDIILANINYNILVDSCETLYNKLSTNGHLLLSGIMEGDIEKITEFYINKGFKTNNIATKNNWAMIHMVK